MSHRRSTRRPRPGRTATAVLTTLGAALTAGLAGVAPAGSAEPSGDCTEPFPVAEVAPGDEVTGLSVTSGTTPSPFTGEVIGLLHDGIAPGVDMLMVRLTSAELSRVGGIWQGMSGSPVYAADGRLLGAVAYGLSNGPSPVAGVTPFAQMDDYVAAGAPARTRTGHRRLPMPLGVSGLSAERLAQVTGRDWLPRSTYPAGGARAAAGAEALVAGGNVAASLSYGDITQAAVGTVTWVCNGTVVAMGHPVEFQGRTSMGLHPADALYVQEDPVAPPFKVANVGAPVGTVTDDRLTGITALVGPLPDTAQVASTVHYAGRSRTGTTLVTVPDALAGTTLYQVLANHDRVVDGLSGGSELMSWTIAGTTRETGSPVDFELAHTERYASPSDLGFEVGFEVADLVDQLTRLPGVVVHDVTATSTVVDDYATWRVTGLQQRRDGRWVDLGRSTPLELVAGRTTSVRAVLTGPAGTAYRTVSLRVPRSAAGLRGDLYASGGSEIWPDTTIGSVDDAESLLDQMVRNDEVRFELSVFADPRPVTVVRDSEPSDRVVVGQRRVGVRVR